MHPRIMGVLNTTPDSFYDGASYTTLEKALAHARQILRDGAEIIDIGGESTRPSTDFHLAHGSVNEVSEEEEKNRVLPVIEALRDELTEQQCISVDTRKVSVAEAAIRCGAKMINYVTDSVCSQMAALIAAHPKVYIVICHMRGQPRSMQDGNFYVGPIVPHLMDWFQKQVQILIKHGVHKDQIILDPGIGFGKKKPDQDLEILRGLSEFKALGFPILIGLSRKSFMGTLLNKPASQLLSATLVLNQFAASQGADIIRVHDVAEHKDAWTLLAMVGHPLISPGSCACL